MNEPVREEGEDRERIGGRELEGQGGVEGRERERERALEEEGRICAG